MKPLPLLALLVSCSVIPAAGATSLVTTSTAEAEAEDARLLAFLDRAFDESLALSPQTLTKLGIKSGYDRLDDHTDAHAQRMRAISNSQVARMKSEFAYARLSPAAQLNYRLFEYRNLQEQRMFEWRAYAFPVTTIGSPASEIPAFLINEHKVDTVADAEAYVARLRDVDRVMSEVVAGMRDQAERGIVPPKFNFAPVRADAQKIISGAPFEAGAADNALFADFKKKVNALPVDAKEKARLITAVTDALTRQFKHGIDTMLAALDEIEPKAKGNDGAWSLPRGGEYYAARLRDQTTTALSADQIHRIGLNEVSRIHVQLDALKQQVGFAGTLQQFFAHIKDGKEFKYPDDEAGREQYLSDATAIIGNVMAVAPRWFSRLPKAPLEVRAVESWRQQTAPFAFYNEPSPDGARPGIYYVNLADMNQVLKPQLEAIAYHEGAPGHHFQVGLQQEMQALPKFRRFGMYPAYTEGWGLYAEGLGREMGFYRDPYSVIGSLSLELWRAARLVIDTGIHAKQWSREQAIDYFRHNSLLSERDAAREVDRYFNIPGQAASYKIGQLKILELRERARYALGERLDIKEFHATILENGSLPLDLLEQQVDAYIASNK